MPGPGSRQKYPRGKRGGLSLWKKKKLKGSKRARPTRPIPPGTPRVIAGTPPVVPGTPGGGYGGGQGVIPPDRPPGGASGGVVLKQAGGFVHRRNQRRQG